MPRWLLYTLLTMFLWGGWGLVSKPLADSVSAWQVQSISTIGLLPVLGWLASSSSLRGGSDPQRGFWLALLAGIVTCAGNIACYQALAMGGKAAAVIPLTALYPLVTIVLALLCLGERLTLIQVGGIGLSLAAVYCFNVSKEEGFLTPWLMAALAPVGLWGLSAYLQKLATLHASAGLATLAFLLGFIPVALVIPLLATFNWDISGSTWRLLMCLGFLFALGNLTLILAYSRGGEAAVVTPMASLYSIVTIPLAVLLLGERITGREGLGISLALVAVIALSWERRPLPPGATEGPNRPDSLP